MLSYLTQICKDSDNEIFQEQDPRSLQQEVPFTLSIPGRLTLESALERKPDLRVLKTCRGELLSPQPDQVSRFSTLDISDQAIPGPRGCPVHCRLFHSLPGLYLPDASGTPIMTFPDIDTCPLGAQPPHQVLQSNKHCRVFASLTVPTALRVRGGNRTLWNRKDPGSNLGSATARLRDLGQVTSPLCASVSSL